MGDDPHITQVCQHDCSSSSRMRAGTHTHTVGAGPFAMGQRLTARLVIEVLSAVLALNPHHVPGSHLTATGKIHTWFLNVVGTQPRLGLFLCNKTHSKPRLKSDDHRRLGANWPHWRQRLGAEPKGQDERLWLSQRLALVGEVSAIEKAHCPVAIHLRRCRAFASKGFRSTSKAGIVRDLRFAQQGEGTSHVEQHCHCLGRWLGKFPLECFAALGMHRTCSS